MSRSAIASFATPVAECRSQIPQAKLLAPRAGERYSIHDVVFDDIDDQRFQGHGNLAQIGMGRKPDVPNFSTSASIM